MTNNERQMTPEGISLITLDRAVEILLTRAKAIVADDILTREEAAKYLKFSENHFDRLVAAGKIRFSSLTEGGAKRFLRSMLLEDLKAHCK